MLHDKITKPVRVIIVDDTRSIRAMIRAMLTRSPNIEVVAEAGDPYEARELIRELNPDVITLDVVMPRMDGLSFLERLMRLRPMPVVMVSTRTTEKSAAAIQALSLGAFDCVDIAALNKGSPNVDLANLVIAAAASTPRGDASRMAPAEPETQFNWNGKTVLIGSSTGGVDALSTVLSQYPKNGPATVIAQHMPTAFLESFAARLTKSISPEVRLAKAGDRPEQGVILLAPGSDTHLAFAHGREPRVELVPHDGTELFVPSINVMFRTALPFAKRLVAVMLTGMGKDGAEPMLDLRNSGTHTIAQDEASSVVDGMPKAARTIGAAAEVASLNNIGASILTHTSK